MQAPIVLQKNANSFEIRNEVVRSKTFEMTSWKEFYVYTYTHIMLTSRVCYVRIHDSKFGQPEFVCVHDDVSKVSKLFRRPNKSVIDPVLKLNEQIMIQFETRYDVTQQNFYKLKIRLNYMCYSYHD